MTSRLNVFAGSHFDRLGHRRRDDAWLTRCFDEDRAVCLPVWNDRSLVVTDPEPGPVFVPAAALPAARTDGILLGEFGTRVCFAVDLGEDEKGADAAPRMPQGEFRGLRTIGLQFARDQAALLAYAQAMVLWHRRHRHCGRCGAPSVSREAGHALHCGAGCGQTIFPRIDPAIIVLVEHDGRALLGRQPAWPAGMYSTVAGFVEPGESLEDAVRREVAEETGVTVGPVRYHSSQPWPFPSSLMLGFMASAVEPTICLNDDELEDARWFSRADIDAGLRSGEIHVPPHVSISSRLIARWYDDGEPGKLAAVIERYG